MPHTYNETSSPHPDTDLLATLFSLFVDTSQTSAVEITIDPCSTFWPSLQNSLWSLEWLNSSCYSLHPGLDRTCFTEEDKDRGQGQILNQWISESVNRDLMSEGFCEHTAEMYISVKTSFHTMNANIFLNPSNWFFLKIIDLKNRRIFFQPANMNQCITKLFRIITCRYSQMIHQDLGLTELFLLIISSCYN